MFENVNVDFLKDWSKTLSKSYDELKAQLFSQAEKLVKNGGLPETEALEEAKNILFIDIKSEMQSSAKVWYGYVYGATAPFDWTSKTRDEAMAQYKKLGQGAIGTYVIQDPETKNIKTLWWNAKDSKNKNKVLDASLIRTFYGMAIDKESLITIEIIDDLLAGKLKKPEEYEGDFNKWSALTKEQLAIKKVELWKNLRWFDMTVSGKYADPTAKDEFVEVPQLYKPMVFKAVDKTTKENYYVLNCSSKTSFVESPKLIFTPNSIKHCQRFINIGELDKPFGLKANYIEKISEKGNTQTSLQIYCTEGTIAGDLQSSPYSDMLRLDDLSLGFAVDKSVTLFLPKDQVKFGKQSRVIIFGKLTRKFDSNKKAYGYPSIQVESWYVLKLVKPVEESEVISNMTETIPEMPDTHVDVKPEEKKEIPLQKTANAEVITATNDTKKAVPLADEKNSDAWGGL